MALRRDVWSSNLPSGEKTAISRVLERVYGGSHLPARVKAHVVATGSVIMGMAESGIVGGAIGAAQAQFGDTVAVPFLKSADGTPMITIPTEIVAAAAGYAAAVALPQERIASVAQRMGDIGVGIWAAAKAKAYVASIGSGSSNPPHGDFGVDRIVATAKKIT